MLAFIVLNYELKLAREEDGRPANVYLATSVLPHHTAEIMFRRRQVASG